MKLNTKIKLGMISILLITLSGCASIFNEEPKSFEGWEVVQKKITKEIQYEATCSIPGGGGEPVTYALDGFTQGANGSLVLKTKDETEVTTHLSNCLITRKILDLE